MARSERRDRLCLSRRESEQLIRHTPAINDERLSPQLWAAGARSDPVTELPRREAPFTIQSWVRLLRKQPVPGSARKQCHQLRHCSLSSRSELAIAEPRI